MANATNAWGLRPVRYRNGAAYTGAANPYYKVGGLAEAFYIGDVVVLVGDSNDAEVSAVGAGTFGPGMLSEIQLATLATTNVTIGVVTAIYPITNASTTYSPSAATDAAIVMVADDPNLVFEVRDDGVSALTADDVGMNAILIAGTDSTATGLSGNYLDTASGSAPAATQGFMLRILNLSRRQDNELAASAVWDVTINQYQNAMNTVGIA